MLKIKELIIPFLLGGSIIAGVKFTSENIHNPAVAAILGAIPTGLISIYFISPNKSTSYSHSYFYLTIILPISVLIFYLLSIHTKLNKNLILLISLIIWIILASIKYFLESHKQNI